MKITRTPVLTSFMILFLILWFFSFRINSLKVSFTKNEKAAYIKKFKFIKTTTLIWMILFLICLTVGMILHFYYRYELSFWSTSLFFITIGTLFLTISSGIHYWIISKIKKGK